MKIDYVSTQPIMHKNVLCMEIGLLME